MKVSTTALISAAAGSIVQLTIVFGTLVSTGSDTKQAIGWMPILALFLVVPVFILFVWSASIAESLQRVLPFPRWLSLAVGCPLIAMLSLLAIGAITQSDSMSLITVVKNLSGTYPTDRSTILISALLPILTCGLIMALQSPDR